MWTSPRWYALAELGGAVVGLLAFPFLDADGRVLVVPVLAVLVGFGTRDLVLTPVLSADAVGLTVLDGLRHVQCTWDRVERMRVVKDRRSPLLELDLGATLVVLAERRLGAPVDEVLAHLQELSRSG